MTPPDSAAPSGEASRQTTPPDAAAPETIAPFPFEPSHHAPSPAPPRSRRILGLVGAILLAILIAGVWFVFTARQLHLEIQPEPVASPRDIDDYLAIGVGVLAGIAVILGVAALVRHEHKRAAVSGIALGGLAIGFQLFAYAIMMIAGALVVAAVVYSLRDAFGDIFGGLFGN